LPFLPRLKKKREKKKGAQFLDRPFKRKEKENLLAVGEGGRIAWMTIPSLGSQRGGERNGRAAILISITDRGGRKNWNSCPGGRIGEWAI